MLGLNLYIIAGLALLSVLVGGVQQYRVVAAQHETERAKLQTAEAEQALGQYRQLAAVELSKRLAENSAVEAKARKELVEARNATQARYDAIRIQYDRLRKQTAARNVITMPEVAGPQPGAVDAGSIADPSELPRCVAPDRRAEFERLLASAEYCAAALRGCRDAIQGRGSTQ